MVTPQEFQIEKLQLVEVENKKIRQEYESNHLDAMLVHAGGRYDMYE
jgi:hypothetical protein